MISGHSSITGVIESSVMDMANASLKSFAEGHKEMFNQFKKWGYMTGINLFPLPYDWRHDSYHTNVAYDLPRILRYAYEMSGKKKAIIIAHSFGNLNTL